MQVENVYIVSAVRTPIATFRTSFVRLSAVDLGTFVAKEALERAGVIAESVGEVIVGCVLTAGLGQNIARQIAMSSGMQKSTQCTTINKVCSSGMKAIVLGTQAIQLGYREVVLAAGTESMSNAPFYLSRGEVIMGNVQLVDGMQRDGLTDAMVNQPMGLCAEKTAKHYSISREEQDNYALQSYKKAENAWKSGHYKQEVLAVAAPLGKGQSVMVHEDEEYKRLIPSKVPRLSPAFLNDGSGTITAANASTINDGAAAILLASKKIVESGEVKPIAQILAYAEAGVDPSDFTVAPAHAVRKLLSVAKMNTESISLWEINEAFSVTPIVFIRDLHLEPERVNVHGGAVALGHPIGASGARIVVTLVHALQTGQVGVATICNGGGEATALLIKKL